MLRTLLVTPDKSVAGSIAEFGQQIEWFRVAQTLDHYPNVPELYRHINQHDADILLLDFSAREIAFPLAKAAREHFDDLVILSFGVGWDDESIEFAEVAGVDGLLVSPVRAKQLRTLIEDAFRHRRTDRIGNLYAFVPAKAGSGTSTLIKQTATMMSLLRGLRLLVLECDLASGVLSEMLDVVPKRSIQDAFESAGSLNQLYFERMIVRRQGVQWLLTNRERKAVQPHWLDYQRILYFTQSRFDWVLADLPETLNESAAEVVRCAKKVFVVSAPEVPSLRLADTRCQELNELDVPTERIGIVLNRWHEGDFVAAEAEELLGVPVVGVVPEDHAAVREAVLTASLVSPDSPIREAVAGFAQRLSGKAFPPKEPQPSPSVLHRMKQLLS